MDIDGDDLDDPGYEFDEADDEMLESDIQKYVVPCIGSLAFGHLAPVSYLLPR